MYAKKFPQSLFDYFFYNTKFYYSKNTYTSYMIQLQQLGYHWLFQMCKDAYVT